LRIVGISSGGGHLTELLTITGHLPQLTALITENGAVKRNDGSGLPLQPILDPHRSLVGFFRNTFQSVRYLQRYKPDVVISTGAGMTVPFFLLARLFGAVCIYVETGARITTPSMTGRILYPFSSFFIVQNKTLLPFYKKAVVASIL
jgi:beta-1,4-N-acetylglucosaminyltransferase